MRKYSLSSRPARVGSSGFAVLYASPRSVARTGAMAQGRIIAGHSRSRARAAARRRRVLSVLFIALAVPLALALFTGSTAAWWVVLALLPLTCAYLAVLFRTRRLMAEREINVAFFGGPDRVETGLEDVFSARYAHEVEELPAVSAGRY